MSFLAFAQDQCALGRAAEAERQLLAQFPQQPFPPSADFGLALAHCNLCLEKLDQVEVCLERVAGDHGDSGALLQLALACARRRGEGSCLPRFRQRLKPFLDQQPIALEWLQLLQEDLDGAAAKAWAAQLLQRWPHGVAVLEAVRTLAWQLQDPVLLGQAGTNWGPAALLWQGRQCWLQGDRPMAEELLRLCLADGSIPLAVQYQALQTLVGQVLPQQVEQLLAAFPQFLRVSPDWAWSLGRHCLAAGAWGQGWPLYEQRYASGDRAQILPPGFPLRGLEQLQQPRALEGRHVLIYGEQGIGDMLMFASLLPELLAEAASVRLLLPPRLVALVQHSFPTALVASSFEAADLNQGQLAFSIGSLGGVYRSKAEDFQGHGPHLRVEPSARQAWRLRLGQLGPGAKVGIAWRGGGSLGSRVQRSVELGQLLPLLQVPGVQWINLQYGLRPAELEDFERCHGIRLHHFEGIGENLQATAALTAALDLVITVQQTALHIAGGLGVPAWVLVPAVAEWRYGLEGTSMPWYSSVQLFRQQQAGVWQSVIEALVQRLRAWLVGHNGAINCSGPGPEPHADGDRP